MIGGLMSVTIDVENFALVTHKVPSDRVRRHLPDTYELQTFTEGNDEFALVSATCFCNRAFRPTALPLVRHTFNESTYRTYIRYRGRDAVYFFLRYLGTPWSTGPQKLVDRNAHRADFDVTVRTDGSGFTRYICRSEGPQGETAFSLSATHEPPAISPFASGEEHEQFITYRLDGHFMSTAGIPAHGPVSHDRMRAFAGELESARFEPWEELGILTSNEVTEPFSVLVTPGERFRLYAPRPAL